MPKKYTARKRRNAVDLYRRRNASQNPADHVTIPRAAAMKRISARTLRRWLAEDDRARARQPLAAMAGELAGLVTSTASNLRTLQLDDRLETLGYLRHAVELATVARLPQKPAEARGAVATVVEGLFKAIEEAVLVAVEEEVEPGMDRNRT